VRNINRKVIMLTAIVIVVCFFVRHFLTGRLTDKEWVSGHEDLEHRIWTIQKKVMIATAIIDTFALATIVAIITS
jgi:hypothetical protein